MSAQHWAIDLIGVPYELGSSGPGAYDCWGLMREACRRRHQLALPLEQTETGAVDVARSMAAARGQGWRRGAPGQAPADGDALLMWGPGGRHIGMVIVVDGHTRVLHAHGGVRPNGHAWGDVRADIAVDLSAAGYKDFELWTLER